MVKIKCDVCKRFYEYKDQFMGRIAGYHMSDDETVQVCILCINKFGYRYMKEHPEVLK